MTEASLALAQTPPLFVPLRYMLTAPVFAVIAAVLILLYPESLQNRWSPVMLGVTHLLVLGFAVMVMFGAVQQLIPVLAGVTLSHPQAISVCLHVGLTLGAITLSAGLFLDHSPLTALSLILLAATVLAFFVIMMVALLRSEANFNSIRGIRLALLCFLVSVLTGLYLAAGHGLPGVTLARNLTPLHLTWGLLGWVGLLVIAVSYQVVPMFQLTPKYPEAIARWLAPFVFVSLLLWSLVEFLWYDETSGTWMGALPEAGVAAGLLTFCLTTLWLQQKRRRKLPDVTLDFFRLALSSMILAIIGRYLPASWFPHRTDVEVSIGILLIIGFAMSVISGMLYKIVPFLVWLHLTNRADLSGRAAEIPNMRQVIPGIHARWQFRLHVMAVLAFATAPFAGVLITRLAAVLLLAANVYLLRNLVFALVMYRKHR